MIDRLSRLLGTEVRSLIRSSGYTVAYHGIAELVDGTTAFVKAATEPVTAEFIRDEQRVLGALRGGFVPEVLARRTSGRFSSPSYAYSLPSAARELDLDAPG